MLAALKSIFAQYIIFFSKIFIDDINVLKINVHFRISQIVKR